MKLPGHPMWRLTPFATMARLRARARVSWRRRRRRGEFAGVKAVPLAWANIFGRPEDLPVAGAPMRLGLPAPQYAGDGSRWLLPDGTIWEYRGISGYKCDTHGPDRTMHGWVNITSDFL